MTRNEAAPTPRDMLFWVGKQVGPLRLAASPVVPCRPICSRHAAADISQTA